MKQFAYVGCRTSKERNARGKGLKVYKVDHDTKEWDEIQLIEDVENPSYMCLDESEEFIYVVHGDTHSVSAYKVNNISGELTFINRIDSVGRNPVFVTVDQSNQYVFVASLQGGCVTSHKRLVDGGISEPIHTVELPGKEKGYTSNAHQVFWDQTKQYLFVPAQGRDTGYGEVNVFRLNMDGSLTMTQNLKVRELDEPRHITVHPNNKFAYIINEKNNSVTTYSFDVNSGQLTGMQIVPSLPETYVNEGQASGIVIDSTGKWLFATNRIHESITIFKVNEKTGFITRIRNTPCLGMTPRFLCFANSEKELLVANEDSDDIRIFDIQHEKGTLSYSNTKIKTESPVCVIFKDMKTNN
jgi:6-phosphogluconolactonase (cycloisomerase 2 family)